MAGQGQQPQQSNPLRNQISTMYRRPVRRHMKDGCAHILFTNIDSRTGNITPLDEFEAWYLEQKAVKDVTKYSVVEQINAYINSILFLGKIPFSNQRPFSTHTIPKIMEYWCTHARQQLGEHVFFNTFGHLSSINLIPNIDYRKFRINLETNTTEGIKLDKSRVKVSGIAAIYPSVRYDLQNSYALTLGLCFRKHIDTAAEYSSGQSWTDRQYSRSHD